MPYPLVYKSLKKEIPVNNINKKIINNTINIIGRHMTVSTNLIRLWLIKRQDAVTVN